MNRISVAMDVMLTNVSLYCTEYKRTLLQLCMTSTDSPGIMFVGFHSENLPGRIVCRGSN